jgi:serine/threonine-protein phosphatase 6 regulatory ankyrin repeat subunit A
VRIGQAYALAVGLAVVASACDEVFMAKEDRLRIEAIKAAVKRDPAAADAPDAEGRPPLHLAVIDRYDSLQEWLLDHGADPNGRDSRGDTVLHVAAFSDHSKDRRTIRRLIRRGADPNGRREDGSTPLHLAAAYGAEATLRALLEGGADPRAVSYRGDTPLHLAATPQPDRTPEACRLFIQQLVARGADPNARNVFGMAPLHMAALVGHVVVVGALLDAGAKVDLEGPERGTSLSIAAVSGHAPVVAELLARGADPRHRDDSGRTALEAALTHPAMQYRDGASGPVDVRAVVDLLRR